MPDDPLHPSPELLTKLAGILHTALHEMKGSATGELAHDPEVIAWAKAMMTIGRCPAPAPSAFMMTIGELIIQVQSMRDHQRVFFAAQPGSDLRASSLTASKACERRVDALVDRLLGPQKELLV